MIDISEQAIDILAPIDKPEQLALPETTTNKNTKDTKHVTVSVATYRAILRFYSIYYLAKLVTLVV